MAKHLAAVHQARCVCVCVSYLCGKTTAIYAPTRLSSGVLNAAATTNCYNYMALHLPPPVRRGAQSKDSVRRRFNVAQLKNHRTSSPEDPTPTDIYQAMIKEEIDRNWLENSNISEKWSSIKSTLDTSASSALGFCKRGQPDWFHEALPNIQHLLDTRNAAYEDWLRRGQQ